MCRTASRCSGGDNGKDGEEERREGWRGKEENIEVGFGQGSGEVNANGLRTAATPRSHIHLASGKRTSNAPQSPSEPTPHSKANEEVGPFGIRRSGAVA